MKAKLTRLSIDLETDDHNGILVDAQEAVEVIEKLEAEVEKLRAIKAPIHLTAALRTAESQFRKYAVLHSDKAQACWHAGHNAEAGGHKAKARANTELADQMLEALLLEQVHENTFELEDLKLIVASQERYKRLTEEELTEFLLSFDPTGVFFASTMQRELVRKLELRVSANWEFSFDVIHVK